MSAQQDSILLHSLSARGPVPQWSARHSHDGCRDARGTGAALPAPGQGRSAPGRHGRRRIPGTFALSTVPGFAAAMPATLGGHASIGARPAPGGSRQ